MRLIKWLTRDSLRKKFIVVSLLLLGVPSIIIGTIGYEMSKQQLDKAGEDQLKSSVGLVIGMINLLNAEVEKGSLSLEDAQEMVRREILGEKDNNNRRSINPRYAIGAEGYLFAMNEQGVSVMNPSNEGKDMMGIHTEDGKLLGKEFIDQGTNGGGFVTYKWPVKGTGIIETKISYVEKDLHWGWIVGAGAYSKDFNQGINKLISYILIALGISLVIGAFIVRSFSNGVIRPITRIAEQAERVAQGDLTVEAISSDKNDEVGKLIHSFAAMIASLRDIIRQVEESAASVAATSEQLTASAEQNTTAGEQIAQSIQEVASGSSKQVESIEKFSAVASDMAKSVESIEKTAQHVAETSVSASQKSLEGNKAIQTVVKQMDSINQTVEGLSHSVRELGDRSTEIGQIVEVITSISAQTNLLALNAAIEAARAGEHGRGFAVVADEVRKLAEQSASSAKQITGLISAIQDETSKTVTSMEAAICEVENGISMVHTAGESFEQIQASVGEVAIEIAEVSSAVKKMAEGVKVVVRNIEVITEVASVTASGSENVSAATQEQLASMEEISSSAEQLTAMMTDLGNLIGRFKIS